MKFEQPKELNRLVAKPIDWPQQWLIFRQLVPIVAVASLTVAEAIVVNWLLGRITDHLWLRLMAILLLPAGFFLLLLVCLARIDLRQRRSLEFRDKDIAIQPSKSGRICWDRLAAVQLEPVPDHASLARIRLRSLLRPKSKQQREWSILLDKRTQLPAFLDELKRRQELHTSIALQQFDRPLPPRRSPPLRGTWPWLLGLFLYMQGGPLFITGLGLTWTTNPNSENIDPAKPRPSLRRFLLNHFHSLEELRRFCVVSGSFLTSASVLCFGWGGVLMSRQLKAAEKLAEQDFLRETELARPVPDG